MKILYGVVGEGMGHATRSKVVIEHLMHDEGHEVEIVVSGRAHGMMEKLFPEVHRIWGLTMAYKDNQFDILKSIVENAKSALEHGFPENIQRYFELRDDFRPQVVISDFESWSYLYGIRHQIPIICVGNIPMVSRCTHPDDLLEPNRANYEISKAFVKSKTPYPTHYFIPTFFYPEVRKPRTTLVPSILRQEILDATPTVGAHVVVYQTSTSSENLPEVLSAFPKTEFRVYGYRRELTEPVRENNVTWCPFSEEGFIRDLASASAVVSNGGFTLMSESVYYRKPFLAIPIASQFEQVMNGYYLEKLGYGFTMDKLDQPTMTWFLDRIEQYRENLNSYNQAEGNQVFFRALDEMMDKLAAGISPFGQ